MRQLMAFALTLVLGGTAVAGSADNLIRSIDKAMTRAKDQQFEYECRTLQAGSEDRLLNFNVAIKGEDWRRLDFTAPGDVKGMRILVRAVDELWIYLPAFRKVRRIASHVKNQGFMGTSFSHDEMSLVVYGPTFTSELLGEDAKTWKIQLNRRKGKDFPYPKLIIEVLKETHQPIKIEYFNDKGAKIKSETRTGFKCTKSKICAPGVIELIDHSRNDLTSRLVLKKWKPNPGLDDSFFSIRALQRGR